MGLAAPTDTGTVIDPDYAATYDSSNDVLDDFTADRDYSGMIEDMDNALTEGGTDTIEGGGTSTHGEATSTVTLGTFTNSIETASSNVMYASVEEITQSSIFSYVGVAATGGHKDDYKFTWDIYCDGVYQKTVSPSSLEFILESGPRADDPDVIISKFKLYIYKNLAGDNGMACALENNHLYTFKCTLTDGETTVQADPIYLYTVPNKAEYDDYYGDLYAHSHLNGTPEDDSRTMAGSLSYSDVAIHSELLFKGADITANARPETDLTFTEMAAYVGNQAQQAGETDYMLTKAWQVAMSSDPSSFPGDEVPIRPFLTDEATLYIPFDDVASGGSLTLTAKQYIEQHGEKIVVLWTNGVTGPDGSLDIKELEGTIVAPEDGSTPYVELPITPSDKYALGSFAIRYVGSHTYNHRFEVRTQVTTENLDATSDTVGGWFVPRGLAGGNFPDSVNFFPGNTNVSYGIHLNEGQLDEDGNVKTFYQLQYLQLTVDGDARPPFVENGMVQPGVNNGFYSYNGEQGVSATGQTVTIKRGSPNSTYIWKATFKEIDVNDAKDVIKLTAEVIKESDFYGDSKDGAMEEILGGIRLLYNDPTTGLLTSVPGMGESATTSIGMPDGMQVRNNAQAKLWLLPNGVEYDVTGIRVSNGDRYHADEANKDDGLYNPDKAGELFFTDVTPIMPGGYDIPRIMNKNAEFHIQVCFGKRSDDSNLSKHIVTIESNDADKGGVWENNAFLANPAEIEFAFGVPQQVALKAKDGYKLEKLTLNLFGMSQDVPAPERNDEGLYVYTLPEVNADYTIYATFVEDTEQHTITVERYVGTTQSDAGGVVSPGTRTARTGEVCDFQIIPNRGYEVASVALVDADGNQFTATGSDGQTQTPIYSVTDMTNAAKNGGTVRITAPGANSRLLVTFQSLNLPPSELDRTDTVTVQASVKGGVGGKVVPNGATNVRVHDSYTMSFEPQTGYEVASINLTPLVNGVPQAATTIKPTSRTYVLPNVTQDYNIEVVFEPISASNPELTPAPTYVDVAINVTNNGSGTGVWSPAVASGGKITVPKGSSVPFSFTPNPGSVFKGATITFTPDDATETPQQIYIGPNDTPYAILSGLSKGTITINVTFDDVNDDTGDATRFALTTQASGQGQITPPSGTTMVGGADQWVNFLPNKAASGNGFTLGDGSVVFDDTKLHAFYSPASATIRFALIGGNADQAGVGEAPYASGRAFKDCGPVAGTGSGLLEGIINQGNYSIKLQSVRSDITVAGTFVAATSGDHNGPDDSKTYRVDACVVEGIGTVSPGGTMRVQAGSSQTFVFKPIAGYKISDIDISTGNFLVDLWNNLTSIFGGNSALKQAAIENGYYTIENIRSDIAVKVSFALDTGTSSDPGANLHPVTVLTDGTNGSVSPSGVVLMERPEFGQEKGETRTFIAKPNPGYTLAGVHVETGGDTVQVTTTTNSLEFTVTVLNGKSTASVVRVTFMPGASPTPPAISGTVNIESSPHGVVSPVGPVDIPQGGSQTINAIPQPGYEIDQILVTDSTGTHPLDPMIDVSGGSFVVGVGGIEGGRIPSNIKVTFKESTFKKAYYNITATVVGGNGTVTPGTCTVPADKGQTIFIQPNKGYKIASITDSAGASYGIDGTATTIANSWLVNPVKDASGAVLDRQLTIRFTPVAPGEDEDKYRAETITVTSGKFGTGRANGVVSPSEGSFEIEKGKSMLMTFYTTDGVTPIFGVKVNGNEVMGLSEQHPLAGSKGSYRLAAPTTNANVDFGVYFGKEDKTEKPSDVNMNVQVGGGGTGSVTIQGSTVSNSGARSSASTGSGAAYGQGNLKQDITLNNVKDPMDLRIIPDNGSQVAKVLMTPNCKVLSYSPNNYKPNSDISQTLTYRIAVDPNQVSDSSPARVYVEFSSLSRESYFDPNDCSKGTYVEDAKSYNTDVAMSMSMDVQGNISDLVGASGNATDLLELRLPSNARQAGNSGTTITYTIPQDADGLTFEVGPLVKLGSNVAESTLYTLDRVEVDGMDVPDEDIHGMISADVSGIAGKSAALSQAMSQGVTVASFDSDGNLTEMPISQGAVDRALARAGQSGTYYQYYTFDTDKLEPTGDQPRTVTVHLRKLSTDEAENGNYFVRNNESNTYNITTSVLTGAESGTLSIWPAGPAVQRGQTVTVSWKPAEGYGLRTLTVGGVDVTAAALAAGSGNFPVVADANKQIVAEFVKESQLTHYNITVTSQGHGTIKAPGLSVKGGQTGKTQVQRYTSAVFTLIPDAGYKPAYVTLDGHRTEWTAYTYPLAGVTDDHTLVFEFARDDGAGGSTGSNGSSTGGNTSQTGIGNAVNSALSKTGDNPWMVVGGLLVLVAMVCGLVAMRMRRASEAAANEAAQRRAYREHRDYYHRRR